MDVRYKQNAAKTKQMDNHSLDYERGDEHGGRRVRYSPRYTQNDIDRNSRYKSLRSEEDFHREAHLNTEMRRRARVDQPSDWNYERFSTEGVDFTSPRLFDENPRQSRAPRSSRDLFNSHEPCRAPRSIKRQQETQRQDRESYNEYGASRENEITRFSSNGYTKRRHRDSRSFDSELFSRSDLRESYRSRTSDSRSPYAATSVRGRLDNGPGPTRSRAQTLNERAQYSRERAKEGMRNIDKNLGSMVSTNVIIGVLVVLLLVALVSVFGRTFLGGKTTETTYVTQLAEKIHTIAGSSKMSANEVASKLEGIGVETTWADKAGTLAQTDTRFQVMAINSKELGREGNVISNKLVKLAVSDPKAIDYVVGFIDKYPQEKAQTYNEALEKGSVPALFQWDERWGYLKYSGTTFGCTGCGPTAMSMVYMGLTGKNDMSPADMAHYATANGFETEGEGTVNTFFSAAAESFGFTCTELEVDSTTLVDQLESGGIVICNVGPGDFTNDGHFIVITGITDEGELSINDPFSSVNSEKTWDIDTVIAQTKMLYAFRK